MDAAVVAWDWTGVRVEAVGDPSDDLVAQNIPLIRDVDQRVVRDEVPFAADDAAVVATDSCHNHRLVRVVDPAALADPVSCGAWDSFPAEAEARIPFAAVADRPEDRTCGCHPDVGTGHPEDPFDVVRVPCADQRLAFPVQLNVAFAVEQPVTDSSDSAVGLPADPEELVVP